jgi:hypothetical protein
MIAEKIADKIRGRNRSRAAPPTTTWPAMRLQGKPCAKLELHHRAAHRATVGASHQDLDVEDRETSCSTDPRTPHFSLPPHLYAGLPGLLRNATPLYTDFAEVRACSIFTSSSALRRLRTEPSSFPCVMCASPAYLSVRKNVAEPPYLNHDKARC